MHSIFGNRHDKTHTLLYFSLKGTFYLIPVSFSSIRRFFFLPSCLHNPLSLSFTSDLQQKSRFDMSLTSAHPNMIFSTRYFYRYLVRRFSSGDFRSLPFRSSVQLVLDLEFCFWYAIIYVNLNVLFRFSFSVTGCLF